MLESLEKLSGEEKLFLVNLRTHLEDVMRSVDKKKTYRPEATEVYPRSPIFPVAPPFRVRTSSLDRRLRSRTDIKRPLSDSSLSTWGDSALYIKHIMFSTVNSSDTSLLPNSTSGSSERDLASELTSSETIFNPCPEEMTSEQPMIMHKASLATVQEGNQATSCTVQSFNSIVPSGTSTILPECASLNPSVLPCQPAAQHRAALKKELAKAVPSWYDSSGSEGEQSRWPFGNSRPPPTGNSHPNTPPAQPMPCPHPIPPPVAPKPTWYRPLISSAVNSSQRQTSMAKPSAATPRKETELEKKFQEMRERRLHTIDEREGVKTSPRNTES